MWFPRRQILVEVYLQHPEAFTNSDPKVFCNSGSEPTVSSCSYNNFQKISINVQAPEKFLLDIANKKSTECNISKITLDGVDINDDNMHKVFKIVINKNNLPVSFDNMEKYHYTVGNKLFNNSYILFDIWENDSISYLLSLGNKMTW